MGKVLEKIKNRVSPSKRRMIGISVDISAQIHEYMKEIGMKQKDLADKLDKNESEISKWLSGSHNFTIETIGKIEEVFGKKIIIVPMFAAQDLKDLEIKLNNESGLVSRESIRILKEFEKIDLID
jgi:transcriptional regulator with XRE-family HTH domain